MMPSAVESIVDLAKQTILASIKPVSVFLIGSFGRNEGSIIYDECSARLLRDIDFLVVVHRRASSKKILSINRIVNSKILSLKGFDVDATSRFVHISQIPLEELLYWNDLKVYDLKHASKLIWGEDIRDSIAISSPNEIPVVSAIRPLLNKYIGLCLSSPLTNHEDGRNTDLARIMELGKTYVEMGTCACIIDGKYSPSYRSRMDIIDRELRWLPRRLKDKILTFTELKLDPSSHRDLFLLNTDQLWFETREDLNCFFLKICEKAYGLYWTKNWGSYVNLWVQRMSRQALIPGFKFYLRKRWGVSSTCLSQIVGFTYQEYFLYRLLKETRFKSLRALTLGTNPLFEMYGLAILLVNSLSSDCSINRKVLFSFIEKQRKLPSIGKKFDKNMGELNDVQLFNLCNEIISRMWETVNRAFYGTEE